MPAGGGSGSGGGGAAAAAVPAKTVAEMRIPSKAMTPPAVIASGAQDVPNSPLAGADRAAVLKYAWDGSAFERVNGTLRGNPTATVPPEMVTGIEDLTKAIDKHTLTRPVVLNRGMADTPQTRALIKPGKTFTDHGFMSTSTDSQLAEDMADPMGTGKGIVFHIRAPAGTKAVSIGDQFDSEGGFNQHEVLVQRGARIKVFGVSQQDGYTHVMANLVGIGKV